MVIGLLLSSIALLDAGSSAPMTVTRRGSISGGLGNQIAPVAGVPLSGCAAPAAQYWLPGQGADENSIPGCRCEVCIRTGRFMLRTRWITDRLWAPLPMHGVHAPPPSVVPAGYP